MLAERGFANSDKLGMGRMRIGRETGTVRMMMEDLPRLYRAYVDCLNRREWSRLGHFVVEGARYNDEVIGLAGYRGMLERDVAAIPDLVFNIDLLAVDPPIVAARLLFSCTPVGELFGLPVNGRRLAFTENVFYRFAGRKIEAVWSVIDKAAIQAQL